MSDWDDEEIGYGRPPKRTRFRKGQSGNPKGRPRKAKSMEPVAELAFDRILLKAIQQQVRVSENGEVQNLSVLEALVRAHLSKALGGNVAAQRDFIRNTIEAMVRESQRAEQERRLIERDAADKAKTHREMFGYFAKLKRERAREWEVAIAAGKDEPDFPWPHPDDILLDQSRKLYRLRGPMNGEGVPSYRWHQALRDLWLTRMVLYSREKPGKNEAISSFYNRFWIIQDQQLPKRWQLLDGVEAVLSRLFEMSLRDLKLREARERQIANSWEDRLGTASGRREADRLANEALAPLLKAQGYHSFKEFERAFVETEGNPPWPRLATAS